MHARARVLVGAFALTASSCAAAGPSSAGSTHPWLDNGGDPIAISHEGLRSDGEPISVQGFVDAYNLGYRYFETDLRLIATGELVALHEVAGDVESSTLAELRALNPNAAPTAVDLLGEATMTDAKWNFELKGGDETTAAALASALSGPGNAADRVCVSFGTTLSSKTVNAIRDALPIGLCQCASISERALDWGVTGPFLRGVDIDPRVVCTQIASEPFRGAAVIQVSARDVRQAHNRSLAVHVYDVLGLASSAEHIERLLDAGVDGIITDDHDIVKQVFEDRGIWPISVAD